MLRIEWSAVVKVLDPNNENDRGCFRDSFIIQNKQMGGKKSRNF